MSDAHGELKTFDEVGAELLLVVPGVSVKWPHFEAGDSGPADLVVVDAANDQLVIGPNGDGMYSVLLTWSGFDSPNVEITCTLFVNGIKQELMWSREMDPGMGRGAASFRGSRSFLAGDLLDIRFSANKANRTVSTVSMNFFIEAITRDV